MGDEETTSISSGGFANANLDQLLCEMEGPIETPYQDRFFLLKLTFSQDFPAAPPRGFFLTKIYHPNVDPQTGAICVNTLKKDWTAETSLAHVLAVIRCLLIVPFPESSLNDEAGKLFMESYEEYAKRARLMAQVHGREAPTQKDTSTSTIQAKDEPLSDMNHDDNSSTNGGGSSDTTRVIKQTSNSTTSSSCSTNPLRNTDNNKKVPSKSSDSNAKMSKKKSLKRL